MIRICAERRADGIEISAIGHADFDIRGRDIVCAAVSALMFGFLHYLKTHLPSAAADESGEFPTVGGDSSGGSHASAEGALRPAVENRVEEGAVWVRTHGMNGIDEVAWSVTRAGLWLVAERYPDHVHLTDVL